MADGGDVPALVDALNFSGIIDYMDTKRSAGGITELASGSKLSPADIAEKAVNYAVKKIRAEIKKFLEEINRKPVYTIHEMVHGEKINPAKMYIIGGPARALSGVMSDGFEINVPENHDVANAIGAALARTTFETELFTDTGKGRMVMPNLDIDETVSRKYSLEEAEADAKKYTRDYLEKTGYRIDESDINIVESSTFRIIDDFYASGNDIRVKCQVKPGVVMHLHG